MCCGLSMVTHRSVHHQLFRYDKPDISAVILGGSIRVTTLEACRTAENDAARDAGEGQDHNLSARISLPRRAAVASCLGFPSRTEILLGMFLDPGDRGGARRAADEKLVNAFVFCSSTIENDAWMKSRFGDCCLRIKDPREFFALVDAALRQVMGSRRLSECVVDRVEYGPRTNNYRDHTTKHPGFLKPKGAPMGFEKESEVRALLGG